MSTSNDTLIQRLFGAGAHFGFKKSRRHPTVIPYLFATKDGVDVFDLEKTAASIVETKEVLKQAGLAGKTILLVGTKDESSKLVKRIAEQAGLLYVANRWIGGMLTNLPEIKKRINRLDTLLKEKESGELERKYTKKERVMIGREIDKLTFNFSGIAKITKTPDYVVVVDPRHDSIAVTEAISSGVPIIAIMSSDCNADQVQYPIIANDSLQTSVSLILEELVKSYQEGAAAYTPRAVTPRETAPRRRAA